MANLHTEYPKFKGELTLAKHLVSLPDDKMHLFFGLDSIPGVPDIDLIIWHEKIGQFIVEVKAVTLGMIDSFSFDKCEIKGRRDTKSPQKQAYDCFDSLRNYIGHKLKLPFFVCTACFPRIAREKWKDAWDVDNVCELSERMLFQEDLFTDLESLKSRLRHIRSNPPLRKGPEHEFHHNPEIFKQFINEINPTSRQTPSINDLERLRILERKAEKASLKEASPTEFSKVYYSGYPGTGKTFRLLRIGINHAFEGRRVLFVCFNKVLASDIRRLISLSNRIKAVRKCFEVYDIFDLLLRHSANYKIESAEFEKEPNEWAQVMVEEMSSDPPDLDEYNTVLIDEAQDMKEWMFRLVEMHCSKNSTICVAGGKGQELYGEEPPWLHAFKNNCTNRTTLRRNFRNTQPVFQVSQIFYETRLVTSRIDQAIKKFGTDQKSKQGLLFERPEGIPHLLMAIDESDFLSLDDDNPLYPEIQMEIMTTEYSRLIRDQIEGLRDDEKPIDLLILIPSNRGMEYEWLISALKGMEDEIDYMDYAQDENRRYIARPDMVRVCTFHSSRGIEGTRVLVFGFEKIVNTAENTNAKLENLCYITLSRTLFECIIAIRNSLNSPAVDFLKLVLSKLPKKN